MDKEQTIIFIKNQIALGNITNDDLKNIAGVEITHSQPVTGKDVEADSHNLINIFYGIGAIIAVVGVIILVAENWKEIGTLGRLVVTLGISFITYSIGYILHDDEHRSLSQVMFTVSAALAPIGAFVFVEEASLDYSWSTQIAISLILAVIYGLAMFITKRNILKLITIGFSSWAYFAIIIEFIGDEFEMIKWAVMLLGASYISIAYGSNEVINPIDEKDKREKTAINNILYALGTLGILGGGIVIGGFFDLLFIALIFGAFYGSVYVKSKIMLILSAIFLTAHIIKLTAEYFADTIGWPVALIFVGFVVIGIGYATYRLNKKYMSVE